MLGEKDSINERTPVDNVISQIHKKNEKKTASSFVEKDFSRREKVLQLLDFQASNRHGPVEQTGGSVLKLIKNTVLFSKFKEKQLKNENAF